jgi:sigma-B regulation protein RsbU (phosphoserine phosphatase)
MNFQADFTDIVAGFLVTFLGSIAFLVSLFRLNRKDRSLLTFGLFCSLYGIRWLAQVPTMKTLVGFPFTYTYFDALATYGFAMPLAALLVQIFGRGIYDSAVWAFRSVVAYSVVAVGYFLILAGPPPQPAFNQVLVILWCFIWAINVIFVQRKPDIEVQVLRVVFLFTVLGTANDNMVNLRLLPWSFHVEHAGFLVMCAGLGFAAVHHFLANENKLLAMGQEMEIARRIQRSNLPSTLRPPAGMNIVARYVPTSAVAGDFYDIRVASDKGVGILIADVSGHGVGAALVGSMLKIAFSSQAEILSEPARVLREINHQIQDKIEQSFVTAFSLYIDVNKKKLRYANAGHPPPLVWNSSTRTLRRLTVGGTILGPFPDAVFDHESLDLTKGDRIILYTDGITEAQNKAGEFFGEDRLEALITADGIAPTEQTADNIITRVFQWSGRSDERSLEDDLTLIVLDVDAGTAHVGT